MEIVEYFFCMTTFFSKKQKKRLIFSRVHVGGGGGGVRDRRLQTKIPALLQRQPALFRT